MVSRNPRRNGPRRRAEHDALDLVRRQLGWYVANAAQSPLSLRYQGQLVRKARYLLDAPEDDVEPADLSDLPLAARPLFHADRAVRRRAVRKALAGFSDYPAGQDPIDANLSFAAETLGLDAIETRILRLLVTYRQSGILEDFADNVLKRLRQPASAVAVLIGEATEAVAERLEPKARLISSGVMVFAPERERNGLAGEFGVFVLSEQMVRVMRRPCASSEDWRAAVCGRPETASLAWEDFAHLGEMRDLAFEVLAGAAGERGVNILLHGPVGTGKTELAKALAARLGVPIWSAGEADESGQEPTRLERLGALRLTQQLLGGAGRALVLLDEAQDLIEGAFDFLGLLRLGGSKVYLNRILEQNEVPTLWTCNALGAVDPAVLRRMTLVIEVRAPTAAARTVIWRKAVEETGAAIAEADIERLARRYDAAPALIASALRAAKLSGRGAPAAELALTASLQVLGRRAPHAGDSGRFDPALTCCAEDLEALADRLARADAPRNWSLCLSGPPGTGKSHYARHVAERLGLEVVQKRASDILGMYVGENEQNIAAAFADARASGALLVFDEADSLLADRTGAQRSWEVSQVNEMLTWMESHPLPFVCTTNLVERLDRASLRRFTFKLGFENLTPRQAALAFERFFGQPSPARLPEGLAPGDFAVVNRKRAILGGDAATLVRWLETEVEAKGARSRPIGFGAAVR